MNDFKINTKKGNNPFLTLNYFIRGLKYLGKPELLKFILIPILINLVLYSVAFALGYHYIAGFIEQLIPDWLQWLNWILWPLFFICFFIITFFTFTLLANLMAAPFYSKLSAKTLALLTGKSVVIKEQPWPKVVWAEVRRIGYLGLRAIPLLILFIIPGINFIAPFLWAIFCAWAIAMEYMAYPLENEGQLFSDQRKTAGSIRLGTLSFGGISIAGLAIPLLNILVPPAAVIGATIYIHEVNVNE
jgi:CysZ protein